MTAVRDTLCNLRPLEIPRPHVPGFQFIPTRGRQGFYKSIRREGAQYGVHIKPMGPRRPTLAGAYWNFVDNNTSSVNNSDKVAEDRDARCRLAQQDDVSPASGKKQSHIQFFCERPWRSEKRTCGEGSRKGIRTAPVSEVN